MNKSPSGSLCPYYYMGGILHPLKYGSYHSDKRRLFQVMDAEEAFILGSSGWSDRRIWIDLYETRMDDEAADKLARHLMAIRVKVYRLCLVGCSLVEKWRIRRRVNKLDSDLAAKMRFFDDPEKAKMWLVGKAV